MKKEVRNRLIVTFAWLVLLTLLRMRFYLPLGRDTLNIIGFWLGGLLGTFLLDLDHLLYIWVIKPQEETSQKIRSLFNQGNYREMLTVLFNTREERTRLAFHSALFQPIFYVLCFYVVTSTTNHLGIGLVMVMALQLLREELMDLLTGREEFLNKWLFWQLDVEVSPERQKAFILAMALIFLGLNLMLL